MTSSNSSGSKHAGTRQTLLSAIIHGCISSSRGLAKWAGNQHESKNDPHVKRHSPEQHAPEGVESISLGAAAVLVRHDSQLRLPSLRELTPDVAEALSAFNPLCTYDRLNLNGLRQLSPESARRLGPFGASLCLGGLKTVSPELAEALVEVRGRILLQGVTRLSYETAGILLSRLDVNLSPCAW